jgi:hypothetical protein
VVTSFELACHPVGPQIFLCAPMYPVESAAAVLRAWRDFMAEAPEELSSNALLWSVPAVPAFPAELHGRPVVVLATLHPSDVAAGERLTRPLRRLGAPLLDLSGPMPYVMAQAAFDPFFPYGTRRYYWKGIDLLGLDDAVIDRLLAAGAARPTPSSLIPIWHFGGAMSRVALVASLALGVIWAAWHLPLFFVPGSQRDLGFPGFLLATVALRVVLTWVFNNTGGSVLLVSLMHQATNVWTDLAGPYADPADQALNRWLGAAVLLGVDAGLVLGFGPARLSRKAPAEVPVVVDPPPHADAPGPAPA